MQGSNLTLAKDWQDMISYGLFSHFEAVEPIVREIFSVVIPLDLEAEGQRSNSTLAKTPQAVIPYRLLSHFKVLEPIIREV